MKLLALTFTVGCIATLAPGSAEAQVRYAQPAQRGAYGGGLIELLMTGHDPGPQRGAADPMAYGVAPMASPAGPGAPEEVVARRAPGPQFQRQEVAYEGREAPGTIVIDTASKFLYLVGGPGQAMRYGIGVGRPGFMWHGVKTITAKREWPDWTPPSEMIKRRPDLPRHMAGGPANPLGARAMYLGSTLYRIHGTNEPYTIGQNVSSGCIRLMNQDVSDLYERVRVGTTVKVI